MAKIHKIPALALLIALMVIMSLDKAVTAEELPTCQPCLDAMNKAIEMAGDDHSQESVEGALAGSCDGLYGSAMANCMSFIDNYGNEAAEMIVIHGTAQGICEALNLC